METTDNVERRSNKQIAFGSILSYILIVISVLLGLFFTPWLSRYLGKNDYGLYTLAVSLIGVFSLDYGLSAGASKFIAECRAKYDKEAETLYLSIILRMYFVIDAFLAAVLIVVYFFLSSIFPGLSLEQIGAFKPLFLVVAVYSLVSVPLLFVNSIFDAYEEFVSLKLFSLINKFVSLGVMSLLIFYQQDVFLLVLSSLVVNIVFDIVKFFYIKRKCSTKIDLKLRDRVIVKRVLSLVIWISLAVLGQELTQNLMPSVLGAVSDAANIAVYGYALTIYQYASSLSNVVAGMFLSKITRIAKDDPFSFNLYPLFLKVGKYQMSLLGLIILGFGFFGQFFIRKLMGIGYADSYLCCLFLMLPLLIQIPKIPMYSHSYYVETVKYSTVIILSFSIVGCGLAFLFGKMFGALGVAASIGVTMTIAYICIDIFVFWKKQKIAIWRFFRECYLRYFLISIPACAMGLILYFLWPIASWWQFTIEVLIFIILYGLIILFVYYSQEEKRSLFSKLSSFFGKTKKN